MAYYDGQFHLLQTNQEWYFRKLNPKGWALWCGPIIYYTSEHTSSDKRILFYRDIQPGFKERFAIVDQGEQAQTRYSVEVRTNTQAFCFDDWELKNMAVIDNTQNISRLFEED